VCREYIAKTIYGVEARRIGFIPHIPISIGVPWTAHKIRSTLFLDGQI
jgi:hypothetical protein